MTMKMEGKNCNLKLRKFLPQTVGLCDVTIGESVSFPTFYAADAASLSNSSFVCVPLH